MSTRPGAADHFASVADFHAMARAGKLPRFSYIEPFWTVAEESTDQDRVRSLAMAMGNDYHPPANLSAGETFLQSIYMGLIANREAWEKTLLIITFDEAVGSFDHVPPPAAVPPWGSGEPSPGVERQYGFEFDRYGVRVPAILVSPRIEKGTVFRSTREAPFDHTSLIATLLKWYGGERQLPRFHERAMRAPTFEGVLTLAEPRRDGRDVRFLRVERSVGEPLKFLDRFRLRSEHGPYLAKMTERTTVLEALSSDDPQVSEYFPTLGDQGVTLFFEKSDSESSCDQVHDGCRRPTRAGEGLLARFAKRLLDELS